MDPRGCNTWQSDNFSLAAAGVNDGGYQHPTCPLAVCLVVPCEELAWNYQRIDLAIRSDLFEYIAALLQASRE